METTVDHLLKEAMRAKQLSELLFKIGNEIENAANLEISYEFAKTDLQSLAKKVLDIAKIYEEISKSSYEQALKEHSKKQK